MSQNPTTPTTPAAPAVPVPDDLPAGLSLPELIAAILQQTGLPLSAVAAELGVHRATAAKYANPTKTPDQSLPWPTWARRIRKVSIYPGGTVIVLWPASKVATPEGAPAHDATKTTDPRAE